MWQNFKDGWYAFVKEVTTAGAETTKIQKMKKVKIPKPKRIRKPKVTKVVKEKEEIDEEIVEEYQEKVDPPQAFSLNEEYIETPKERLDRIRRVTKPKIQSMSAKRRELLWINPGTEKINQALYALENRGVLPAWAEKFTDELSVVKGKLYFEDLPMVSHEEKVKLVKSHYFDPGKQSTIKGIHDDLKIAIANISRKNVQKILRTFETYQLNFPRRHPPKILGRMIMKKPGIIVCDMFFPSKKYGWEGSNVLVMADSYSRYVQAYNLERKTLPLQEIAMNRFMQKFLSLGHIPSFILCDKGSDLKAAKKVMRSFEMGAKVL